MVDAGGVFAVFALNALPPRGGTGTDAWATTAADGTVNAILTFQPLQQKHNWHICLHLCHANTYC